MKKMKYDKLTPEWTCDVEHEINEHVQAYQQSIDNIDIIPKKSSTKKSSKQELDENDDDNYEQN